MASPPFRGGPERQLESHSTTNPNSSGGRPLAAQLEFTQAMTDFKVMFPDMDAEVIEAVLRANNGAVDATIDHLLTMSADNEAEKLMFYQYVNWFCLLTLYISSIKQNYQSPC